MQSVINYYTARGSTVNVCALDIVIDWSLIEHVSNVHVKLQWSQ